MSQTSPAAPASTSADSTSVSVQESDPNVTKLYGILGACGVLALSIALSSFKMFLGLLVGVVLSVVGIYGALYYLLNIAEAKVLQDRKDEVKKKEDQPKMEAKPLPGADVAGFLQVLGPSAQKPTSTWSWGDLKQSTLFYQDLKGQSKGVISLTNARMTVIKTKAGRLWKSTNYIRLVNPDRAILGEYRECVLFFRNGKEMEDWYLALKVATQLHQPAASAAQSARRLHFTSVMRAVGYDWLVSSLPAIPRPSTVSPSNSEISKLQTAASTSILHPVSTSSSTHSHSLALEDDFHLLGGTKGGDSSKWVNLLAHRVFYFLNDDPGFVGLVKKKIAAKLAKLKKPSMLKSLTLKGITFGTKLPIVSNISIRSADTDGSLRLDADMAYHGNASVELDLVVEVEILGTKIASFPISIKVVIKTIVGKVQLAFSPPPSDLMWMGFYTEPHIELEIASFIGEKHRLVNIPQLTNIIVSKLRQEIVEMMLMPDMDDWPLPHLKVPKGQTREKYVQWEYQAGYTPPPAIITEFDSSDSEDDLAMPKPIKNKVDEKKNTSSPSPASTSASNSSSSSNISAHPHPFASTFSSSVDVPPVGMKKRSPSTGSSSSPANATTASSGIQHANSKPLPPTPNQANTTNTNGAASKTAPKLPSRASQPPLTSSATSSSSSVVPLMSASSSPVSLPPTPVNTPNTSSSSNATNSSTVTPLSTPSSAPPSLPVSTAPTPIQSPPPNTKQANTAATSQSQPELPLVADLSAPVTSASLPSLPVSSQTANNASTVSNATQNNESSSTPVRTLNRVPTPPKLELQPLHSSLIECDSYEASDAIFGPEPGTKTAVVESAPFVVHDSVPPIMRDLPVTKPSDVDPLLERAANSAFDHAIEVHRDGSSPTLTSNHQFESLGVKKVDENEKDADHVVEALDEMAVQVQKTEAEESNAEKPSTPSITVESAVAVEDPNGIASKAVFDTESGSESVERAPARELTKSAEPGVVVEASFDPLFHPAESLHSSSSSFSNSPSPSLLVAVVASQSTQLTPSSSAPNLGMSHSNNSDQSQAIQNPQQPQQDWSRIFDAPSSSAASTHPSTASSTPSSSRPSSGKIYGFEETHEAVGRTVAVPEFDISKLPPLPPRAAHPSVQPPHQASAPLDTAESAATASADPFADIFAGPSEHSGFHAALQPAPVLPPRPKKTNNTNRSSSSDAFPEGLYASEPPKTWTASANTKKDKLSTTQSVKATLKGFIDTIKKLDD